MARKKTEPSKREGGKMTLEEFIKREGTARKAAATIGVTEVTVSRWRNGHNDAVGIQRGRLDELGIELPGDKKDALPTGRRVNLERFIRANRTVTKAAGLIGVTRETLSRWRRGLTKPDDAAVERLKDLGVNA